MAAKLAPDGPRNPADRPKTGEILSELTGIAAPTSADWLPGQVTATADGSSQPPGTQLGQYKDINITSGYYIDFVGNPKRPKEGGSDDGDLSFNYGTLKGNNKFGVLTAGQTADYQTCHDNTIYISDGSPVAKDLRLCVYTKTGLLGIILVKNDTSEYVNLDLTVWQGPADQ